ncbi:MAG: TA system VapC family ribonuclease toxin [Terriglobales bacterium]
MGAALLDVNVLVALSWTPQQAHRACLDWFRGHEARGWATCAITQAGCVRVLSNRAVWPGGPAPLELAQQLSAMLASPHHQFWTCDLPYRDAALPFAGRLHGHRQITDAYLLGLAIHRGGVLVTLDRSVAALLPRGSALARHLLVLE